MFTEEQINELFGLLDIETGSKRQGILDQGNVYHEIEQWKTYNFKADSVTQPRPEPEVKNAKLEPTS